MISVHFASRLGYEYTFARFLKVLIPQPLQVILLVVCGFAANHILKSSNNNPNFVLNKSVLFRFVGVVGLGGIHFLFFLFMNRRRLKRGIDLLRGKGVKDEEGVESAKDGKDRKEE